MLEIQPRLHDSLELQPHAVNLDLKNYTLKVSSKEIQDNLSHKYSHITNIQTRIISTIVGGVHKEMQGKG